MSNNFHFLSLNCRGLRDRQKRARLQQYAILQKVQILLIQETHFTKDISPLLNEEFDSWHLYHSFGSNISRGCSILIHKTFDCAITNFKLDENGRYVLLNLEIENSQYTLINVYANNDSKNRNIFFQTISSLIENNSEGSLIIGGDMNDTLESKDRIYRNEANTATKSKPVANLNKMIKDHNLCDIWRNTHEQLSQFTWKRKNNVEKSRIDFWLIDANITTLVLKTDIRPACINSTDHQAISLKIAKPNKRGPGYWKFNNSLLSDQSYCDYMLTILNEYVTTNNNTPKQIAWEFLKNEIKEKTIIFSKKKNKDRRCLITQLENEYSQLINNQNEDTQRGNEIENRLHELYADKATGAQIRSRLDFIEYGEKNTRYFLNLEKSRQTRKLLNRVTVESKTYTSTEDILAEEVKYYKTLYTSNNTDTQEIKDYISQTTQEAHLTEVEANLCEGRLTLSECNLALSNMKLNKSPGSDGLSVEFYRHFWDVIGMILVDVYNDGFEKSELTLSQRTGIISLLYKKGDPTDLGNWRPISLLNIDYKIAARVLANRLQKVINKIVSLDQQGYIKNRFIGYNIRQIKDIIDYAELLQIDGAIMFLDFKKAFDTVEWSFMFQTLEFYGFKNDFIRWIKTLYNNCQSFITNNGWLSEPFNPKRGIRQGCPISALLFILVAEIMAIKIRNSNDIMGLNIKAKDTTYNLRVSQLADDTTLFLNSENDVCNSLKLIQKFGYYSGLELNKSKTEAMWIGRIKNSDIKVGGIGWPDKPIKALGIHFGHDDTQCDNLNWENKIEQCRKVISNWSRRKLTFDGKIQIIKTLLIPKFTYAIHSLTVHKDRIKEINKMLFAFLWDNKKEKIKRTTLIGDKFNGGIGMIDLESYVVSIKLKWVRSLLNETDAHWKAIPRYFYNFFGENFLVFYMNIDSFKSLNTFVIPEFYKNILELWIQTNNIQQQEAPKHFADIRKEVLWGNKYIKYKGKSLIFKNWISSEILFVNDIIDRNGTISEDVIYRKLDNKRNWISEFTLLKQCIPKNWRTVLTKESSCLTKVNTYLKTHLLNKDLKDITNKDIYKHFVHEKFTKPYIHNYWEEFFQDENINWFDLYTLLNSMPDNKMKQFKYKAIHRIFPSKEVRFKWKMTDSPKCNRCDVIETYEHVFIRCTAVNSCWEKFNSYLRTVGINKDLRSLRTIILGYKIEHSNYFFFNILLTLFGWSIYKTYFMSESRCKPCDIFKCLKYDFSIIYKYYQQRGTMNIFLEKFKIFVDGN